MKKFAFGCLGCLGVVIVIGIIGGVLGFVLTKDIVKATDRFFALVQAGKTKEAYAATAKEFQASTSEEQFEAFLQTSSLAGYESAAWHSRSIENDQGKLKGKAKTKDGGQIPLVVTLVKEGETWKILRIDKEAAGIQTGEGDEAATQKMPDEAALNKLAESAVLLLAESVNKDDFSLLFNGVSKLWQSQTNAGELRDAFKTFVDNRIDLSIAEGQTPVFSSPPALNADGFLVLEGYFTTKPNQVRFKLKFGYEHPAWKLVGLNVNM
ncbi:MAG: hypothetical protein JXR37_09630 [Kiritimatiellae bacterium]|nr:hypothetical protein [Kiritimatiellia bacterium]